MDEEKIVLIEEEDLSSLIEKFKPNADTSTALTDTIKHLTDLLSQERQINLKLQQKNELKSNEISRLKEEIAKGDSVEMHKVQDSTIEQFKGLPGSDLLIKGYVEQIDSTNEHILNTSKILKEAEIKKDEAVQKAALKQKENVILAKLKAKWKMIALSFGGAITLLGICFDIQPKGFWAEMWLKVISFL